MTSAVQSACNKCLYLFVRLLNNVNNSDFFFFNEAVLIDAVSAVFSPTVDGCMSAEGNSTFSWPKSLYCVWGAVSYEVYAS